MPKAETIATWSISLDCTCPKCNQGVDLLVGSDFWDGRHDLRACEHDTPRTDNMEVSCPECGHEFEVCCEY